MSFQIVRNDITSVHADAIVNTANPKPRIGNGTDRAVYNAAGKEQLLETRKKIGEIAPGQAVSTPAFNLTAKYIIHTVSPVWEGGDYGEFDTLKACYENSLQLARKLKCRSIAFPLLAAGSNGFPKDKALQIAMSVIQPFVMEHSMKVILVVFNKRVFELSGEVVDNIQAFIDENYVEEAKKRERPGRVHADSVGGVSFDEESRRSSRRRRRYSEEEEFTLCEEQSYPEPIEPWGSNKSTHSSDSIVSLEPMVLPKQYVDGRVDINELLKNSEKTFQEKLFEIIDGRGLTGPQVYKNYISKQVYSKIQADKNYHPNKFTALALCLSLHLNLDETQDLIGRAGWTLSRSNRSDLVVTGCIMNKKYNLVEVNLMLFKFDCPTLEKIK